MIPIHVACLQLKRKPAYLFLRKLEDRHFNWFRVNATFDKEDATECSAETLFLAIATARKLWKESAFRLLHAGFHYSLPERDVVGSNALFWQMAKSYESFNGQYFDPEVGHLCYVDFASQEALEIWRKIRCSVAMNA